MKKNFGKLFYTQYQQIKKFGLVLYTKLSRDILDETSGLSQSAYESSYDTIFQVEVTAINEYTRVLIHKATMGTSIAICSVSETAIKSVNKTNQIENSV